MSYSNAMPAEPVIPPGQNTLSDEDQKLIAEEERLLSDTIAALRAQYHQGQNRFAVENERARALTSELVAARTDEERWMLASDEAVAHGLTAHKVEELKTIESLLERPYFARVVLEEDGPRGSPRRTEFKLGFVSNTDCRIIDWRKAPIARLYYEYNEGDEFSESVQGRERTGQIALKRSYEIKGGKLLRITTPGVSYELTAEGWRRAADAALMHHVAGELPPILSLITADQFRMITEGSACAVMIQGVAGSGKTTVALHRLAWLLHHENSDLAPEESIVVVRSPVLKRYTEKTLPAMEVQGVRVLSFTEFSSETVLRYAPRFADADRGGVRRLSSPCPSSVLRLKHSFAALKQLEKAARSSAAVLNEAELERILRETFSNPRELLTGDDSRLLDEDLVRAAAARTAECLAAGALDPIDEALLLRAIEIRAGGVMLKSGRPGTYRHLVADEVQDFSAVELAALLGAVDSTDHLTLVGDTDQQLSDHGTFPGWDKLRLVWGFKEGSHQFHRLTVSHRSTLPIMRFAESIHDRAEIMEGRKGRAPIWFRCRGESYGIKSVQGWLEKALQRYPTALTAVLCANMNDAKLALSMLQPAFGPVVRLGSDATFSFEQGIVVTAVPQAKGLEFVNVLLWNPSARDYPNTPLSRNLLYVAATRAAENLCIVTWSNPSPVLPSFNSPLVRGVPIGFDDEQEQQQRS